MYQNNIKSATTAGLLGIFLGSFGTHNWYLGDKKKGIIHVSLAGAGFLMLFLSYIILPNTMSFLTIYRMAWLFTILNSVGWLLISGSEIWGFIEGIQILTGGDAGLAARGYAVAQPMQPMQPMGQPNQFVQQNQPMPNQPMVSNQPAAPQNQPLNSQDQSATLSSSNFQNGGQNGQ